MIAYFQEYLSEIIASFAVFVAIISNVRVVNAEKRLNKIDVARRRTDMLVEIERKNIATGKLALISARKLLAIRDGQNLSGYYAEERERLEENLSLMKEFQAREEYARKVAEEADVQDIDRYHETMADIIRTRVSLEADFENESETYDDLVNQIKEKKA